MPWTDQITFDERGLVPVVAQDARTGEVLMLAWANAEALQLTQSTGRAHYWSRSRRSLWAKGETSGHVQEVEDVRMDCDGDAVLYRVRQTGPACHTGERSCFHRGIGGEAVSEAADPRHMLDRLDEIIARREQERPEGSYTTYLFAAGIDKVLKKVGEEATETVMAAKDGDAQKIVYEVADLWFHCMLVLSAFNLKPADVLAELERREGLSGLEEFAARKLQGREADKT